MKVLHVSPFSDAASGGPVSTLAGLARAQAQAGDTVTIATMRPHTSSSGASDLARLAAGAEVHVMGTERGPLRSGKHMQELDALITSADIVHVHGVWEDIVSQALRGSSRADIPCVLRPCGMLTEWSMRRHSLRKRVLWRLRTRADLARADAIHFASVQEQSETRLVPFVQQDAFVAPNGITPGDFAGGDKLAFRKRHGLRPTVPVVLFLGRLHPGKGLEFLIPAFADAHIDAVLVIAGPGAPTYRRTLEDAVRNAQLEDRVIFTGMLDADARRDALAAAAVFVLPSEHESFGNAALEALAVGSRVLVSDRVPLAEAIGSSGAGWVCQPTRDSIASALRTIGADIDSTADSQAAARACAAAFDWTVVADGIRRQYGSIISGTAQ